jgi:hypothetical protein
MDIPVIKTLVLLEKVVDVPETPAAGAPDGPGVPVFEMLGGALYSADADIDAAGQTHDVFATGLVENSNITYADYRIVPRHPGPYPAEPYARIEPTQKIDTVTLTHTGDMVLVYLTTHAPGPGPRKLRRELAVIPGVWRTTPQHEAEEGGAGAYRGGDMLPTPEVEPVDYEEIERRVNFVVERIVGAAQSDSLVNKITAGQGSMRQQLRALGKQATRELLTGTDQDAQQYKDALYQFVKNANAGVQANILGGQDPWGVARRDEMKAIIREVLQEIDVDTEEG